MGGARMFVGWSYRDVGMVVGSSGSEKEDWSCGC